MLHYLQMATNDAPQILAMVKSHSTHQISSLYGFILVARTFDDDGTLRAHALKLENQLPITTDLLLEDGQRLFTTD